MSRQDGPPTLLRAVTGPGHHVRMRTSRLAAAAACLLLLACDEGLEPVLPEPPAPSDPLVAIVIDDGTGYALEVLRQEIGDDMVERCRASRMILGPGRWTIVYRCARDR